MGTVHLWSSRLPDPFPGDCAASLLDHVNKTLELIAKQKVFYARLALLSHQDEEAREIKLRIDTMTKMYSNGKHINQVLDEMEEKLRQIKKSLS